MYTEVMASTEHLSIRELADAVGVSRRAIRFYVARRLLPPPDGRGRGGRYSREHLERLVRIRELQRAGHSLDAIERILAAGAVEPPPVSPRPSRMSPQVCTSLWTRLVLAPGLELHFDLARHELSAERIVELRDVLRGTLSGWDAESSKRTPSSAGNGYTQDLEEPS